MRIKLLLYFFLLNVAFVAQAQEETKSADKGDACSVGCDDAGWCWGADKTTSETQWTLLSDNVTNNMFKESEEPLEWLMTNVPCLNVALYINAEKVYKALIKENKDDAAAKMKYQDKLIDMYYQRIKYFEREEYVKQRMGSLVYAYFVNRGGNSYKEKRPHWTKMYNIYDDIIKIAGDKTKYYNVRYFILSSEKMFRLNKDTAAFIADFDKASAIVDKALPAAKKTKAKWEETKNAVIATFNKALPIDCEFVKERWIPEVKKDKSNIDLAKKSIAYMLRDSCATDPEFIPLVEIVYDEEKSAGMALLLAQHFARNKEYEKAELYYNEVISLAKGTATEDATSEEDPAMQAKGLMGLGGLKAKDNKYSAARKYYLEAASVDPNTASDAYSKIGDLYYSTAKNALPPAELRDPVANKAGYLAAYDMYAKAGNSSGMARAKRQFPTVTDVFQWKGKRRYEEGKPIKVYGWIGGSAILRTK